MNHIRWWKIIKLIMIFSLLGSLPACGEKIAYDTLKYAIDELAVQPEKWEETLNSAIEKFGIVSLGVARQVRLEIETLMRQTVQTAQEASFCEADFIGIRVHQLVQGIMYKYFPDRTSPPSYVPVICTIDPNVVQSDSTHQVSYSGFDFLTFRNTGSFTADLYLNGHLARERFGQISVATNYKLILDIQAADYSGISGSAYPQIVLRWKSTIDENPSAEEAEGRSELPINIVVTPPPPFVTVCKWTGTVSEENPPIYCASGYAMRGVKCTGEYCDNMSLYCCNYLSGPDPQTSGDWTGWFSEERNYWTITPSGRFVTGLACSHDYCDNVNLFYTYSNSVRNADQCYGTQAISEENPNQVECGDNEFVAGMYCTGEYCDNVALWCCNAQYP